MSVVEYFGISEHNAISFNIIIDKDKIAPQVKVRYDIGARLMDGIKQEIAKIDCSMLFTGNKCVKSEMFFKANSESSRCACFN